MASYGYPDHFQIDGKRKQDSQESEVALSEHSVRNWPRTKVEIKQKRKKEQKKANDIFKQIEDLGIEEPPQTPK